MLVQVSLPEPFELPDGTTFTSGFDESTGLPPSGSGVDESGSVVVDASAVDDGAFASELQATIEPSSMEPAETSSAIHGEEERSEAFMKPRSSTGASLLPRPKGLFRIRRFFSKVRELARTRAVHLVPSVLGGRKASR